MHPLLRAFPMLAAALCFQAACDVDLGERVAPGGKNFGEIVYKEACQRVTYTHELVERKANPARPIDVNGIAYRGFCNGTAPAPMGAPLVTQVLSAERQGIVESVNLLVPEPILTPLDGYLRTIVPLEEEGTVGQVTGSAGRLLLSLSKDSDALAALARLSFRDGFTPPSVSAGLPRALLADAQLDETLGQVLPLVASSRYGGMDARARGEVSALLAAVQAEMASASKVPDPSSADRTLRIALHTLLTQDPALKTGAAIPAVLRDHRGLARVSVDGMGKIPGPHADRNGDGLADVDTSGRFVDAAGTVLPVVSPFPVAKNQDLAAARDAQGRALRRAGDPSTLYQYIDLDQTVLAALLREGQALLDPEKDVPLSLLAGAGHLLGPRKGDKKGYAGREAPLQYTGYADEQGPLLDLIHGFVQILGYTDGAAGDTRSLLRAVSSLTTYHEREASRSLAAALAAFDEAKKPAWDAAKIAETSTLYDDLAPILVRIARKPQLVSDLVEALRDPAAADLGPLLGLAATESGYFFMNQTQLDYRKGGAFVGTPGKTIRRGEADSDVDKNTGNPLNNRSVLQRVLHLVHDANGLSFCSKKDAELEILFIKFKYPDPCSLFQINDLALFYILSIISDDIEKNPGAFAPSAAQVADFSNALSVDFVRNLIRLIGPLSDALIEGQVGIPGFGRFPPPQAAGRLLFLEPARFSNLMKGGIDTGPCAPKRPGTLCCGQNHGWRDHHDGVLFAVEALHPPGKPTATLFTALAPVIRVFAKYDECTERGGKQVCTNAAKILVDLLSVLHRHWPSSRSRFYGLDYEPQNQKSGAVSYEPLFAHLMGQTDLWPSTVALAPALRCVRTAGTGGLAGINCPKTEGQGGNAGLPIVASFLRWFLDPALSRQVPLRYRNMATVAKRGDGKPAFGQSGDPVILDVLEANTAGKVTPYYLLADAFRNKRARFAMEPTVEARWKVAISSLADQMLLARQGPVYGFANPRFRPVSQAMIDMLIGRVDAHNKAGDLSTWVETGLVADLRESLVGPSFSATVDLAARLSEDPMARKGVQRLLRELTNPAAASTFHATLSGTADLLQLLLDDVDLVPLVRGVAPAFAPNTGVVDGLLGLLRRGREKDPGQILLTIARNGYKGDDKGNYPLATLADSIAEINRQKAGDRSVWKTPLLAEDYKAILSTSGEFLTDQQRGVERCIEIVKTRHGK